MIERILPGRAAFAEALEDSPAAPVFSEEVASIGDAVGSRRLEFTTARDCARRALAKLGRPPVPIPRGESRAPVWPRGIVGSITHCEGYRAAAVARAADVPALGIDAEPHGPLGRRVLEGVAVSGELGRHRELSREHPEVHWGRVLFSAKESVYKAWYPLTQRWLGFEDAEVTLRWDGLFEARLLVSGATPDGAPLAGFAGRWTVTDRLVLTAVTSIRRSPAVAANELD